MVDHKFSGKRKFKPYWVNISSNTLVSDLIRKGNRAVQMAMEGLLQGKPFEASMDEEIIFSRLGHSENAVWSLFVAGGYLKAAGRRTCDHECGIDTYTLMITNLEVKKMLRRMILEWFSADGLNLSSFTEALLAGDKEYMNQYLNEIMYATLSCYDTGREQSRTRVHENFYHGFVLGLVADLRGRYVITSNRESGLGRYDVMLKPRNAADCGIILEFKVLDPDREQSMQETADAALRQIIEKGYAAGLEKEGISMDQIRIYG